MRESAAKQLPARANLPATSTSTAPRRVDVATRLEPYFAPAHKAREWAFLIEKVRELWPLNVADVATLNEREMTNCREKALSRHKRLPSLYDLCKWELDFGLAVHERADEPTTRMFLGIMFDAFPGRANEVSSAIRIDMLVSLLRDEDRDLADASYGERHYSRETIAWSVRRAIRTQSFAPSSHEFLNICHDVRNSFIKARSSTRRMIDLRCDAERFLLQTGDIDETSEGLDDDIPF